MLKTPVVMGLFDWSSRKSAAFGARHPTIGVVLVLLFVAFLTIFVVVRLVRAFVAADILYVVAGALSGVGFQGWWAHLALVRKFRSNAFEKIAVPVITLASGLSLAVLLEEGLLPPHLELAALAYAAAFLVLSFPLIVVGWSRGRKLSPEERLRQSAPGFKAALGIEAPWEEESSDPRTQHDR